MTVQQSFKAIAMAAQEYAAKGWHVFPVPPAAMSAAERAAAAEQQRQVVAMGLAINDPAQWDAFVTQQGATDLVGQFNNRQMLATRLTLRQDRPAQGLPTSWSAAVSRLRRVSHRQRGRPSCGALVRRQGHCSPSLAHCKRRALAHPRGSGRGRWFNGHWPAD